jgi:hypothetical protein
MQVHHFVLAKSGPQRGQRKMKKVRQQQTDAGCIQESTIVLASRSNSDELRKHSEQESRP